VLGRRLQDHVHGHDAVEEFLQLVGALADEALDGLGQLEFPEVIWRSMLMAAPWLKI
jgi:hypothetical protein